MTELEWLSPLQECTHPYVAPDFRMRELDRVAKVRVQALRSRGMNSPAADSGTLPAMPNTALGHDPVALWRAPDDWLLYSLTLDAVALSHRAGTIGSAAPLIVTDVSSASVVLELSGARSTQVLMRDCTLDLEGGAISPGACARTLFAQTTVIIHHPEDFPDTWRFFVERSIARHVWDWLIDSAGPPTGASS